MTIAAIVGVVNLIVTIGGFGYFAGVVRTELGQLRKADEDKESRIRGLEQLRRAA